VGRKQNRKRARRQRARGDVFDFAPQADVQVEDPWEDFARFRRPDEEESLVALMTGRRPPAVKSCGSCREFIEDGEFGRGTCLHPGSGVFAPWDNTPGCAFHAPRRR
jgi:hypothetical protein